MKRVLVGVDGSAAAGAALGWAGRLAARVGAEVVVANVFEAGQSEVSPDELDKLMREAADRLAAEWSEPLRSSGVADRSVLLSGSPETLLDAAVREAVDLLVVGTRGHGGFAALHVGSVAHHLAHYTRRPLAIVPEPGASATIDRVVVGVDGSEGSAAAVRWCGALTGTAKVEVVAAYVFEPGADWLPRSHSDAWRDAAEPKMSEWVAPLREAGIEVRTRIIEDAHPVAALTAAVEDASGGLLVVGTRGLSGVVGLRLGRVPLQLVHHSQLPVVLVPPAADEKEQHEPADS